jgi:hypothetical protein
LTAEAEAEKPTRKPPARKDADSQAGTVETDDDEIVGDDDVEETDEDVEDIEVEDDEPQAAEPEVAQPDVVVTADGVPATPVKKKTRRGSRGGKNRKKPAGAGAAEKPVDVPEAEAVESEAEMPGPRLPLPQAEKKVTIHLPSDDLGREDEVEDEAGATVETPSENGAPGVAKKKTRRGSRGGKNRRKRTAAAAAGSNGAGAEAGAEAMETVSTEPAPVEAVAAEEPSTNGAPEEDWGYVPMSEWVDELDK